MLALKRELQGNVEQSSTFDRALQLIRGHGLGFDVAVFRLVLQHLPGKQAEVVKRAAKTVFSVLFVFFLFSSVDSIFKVRPGGSVVCLDVDENFPDVVRPDLPLSDALFARMSQLRASKGAVPDPRTVRRNQEKTNLLLNLILGAQHARLSGECGSAQLSLRGGVELD